MGCFASKGGKDAAAGGGGTGSTNGSTEAKAVKPGGFSTSNFIFDNKGKVTDTYQVDNKKLGQGTYGSVSKATQKATNQVRAIKSISKASSQVKNLERYDFLHHNILQLRHFTPLVEFDSILM